MFDLQNTEYLDRWLEEVGGGWGGGREEMGLCCGVALLSAYAVGSSDRVFRD